jgi:hypothetical protein
MLVMLESTSMISKISLFCLLLAAVACAPEKAPTPAASSSGPVVVGTLTVDAEISKGTRFRMFANDQWAAPEIQPVIAGQRAKYTFPLPATLRTLRLDPGEMPDTHTVIYSVVIALPGLPKKSLPLVDLNNFLKANCTIAATPTAADIKATGPEMYFMANVSPATYPAVP